MAEDAYTTNRPIHERIYSSGPAGWGWTGVCEVDDTERAYRQHNSWPVENRSAQWHRFDVATPLNALVNKRVWQLVLDPALVVSEGL